MLVKLKYIKRISALCMTVFAVLSMGVNTTYASGEALGPGYNLSTDSNAVAAQQKVGPGYDIARKLETGDGIITGVGDIRIYVSRNAKKVHLYENGIIKFVWPCNVGKNTNVEDKRVEGDKITPLGKFYVCTRNNRSIAYLSLGLSYPSIEHAERGFKEGLISVEERDAIVEAINNKLAPPWKTALGGEIMIHGGYSPGDTTNGCVAVANEVMDILWQHVGLGVEVEIGS